MKTFAGLLVVATLTVGCGGGDNVFTDADWDELHQWCLEHRARPYNDCGAVADGSEGLVNEGGWDKDCMVRTTKRGLAAPTQDAIDDAVAQAVDCPRDG